MRLTRIPSVRLTALRARNFLAFPGSISQRAATAQGAPDEWVRRIGRRATGPAGLEIRPLTLIFGRNSSGKSALIKLIRMALRAIAEPTTDRRDLDRDPSPGSRHLPLRIDELDLAPRFIDLVHGRFSKELGLGLELELDDLRCGYDVELLPADTVGDRSLLLKFWGHEGNDITTLELDLAATQAAQRAIYLGNEQPELDGLAPAGQLPRLRRAAHKLDQAVSHLGPLRVRVPPVKSRGAPPVLGYTGACAPDWLAFDNDLADRVDAWYREHMDGCRMQVRPLADAFELSTTTVDGTAINLAQAGEGLHQVLPVVVQQKLHEIDDQTLPIVDLIEQPELHLHDAVHAPLADLFMATARLGRGAVIVETHSEGLLLRVRRRIAEGAFDPDDLAIHFVDRDAGGSFVRRIDVNLHGELNDWPEGVFLESYREVMAMQRAIRSR
ncbi:MAG TPA: DUF3696 domain-containing protein [Kofleriaceae bacterium]|nr:DUF3696 domain-containing protein [Kofleriaceae bacterium]